MEQNCKLNKNETLLLTRRNILITLNETLLYVNNNHSECKFAAYKMYAHSGNFCVLP